MSDRWTDAKCWTCDRVIEDLSEAEFYGEEIRHIECPEPKEEQPIGMPGPAALFAMAARGLRSPWDDGYIQIWFPSHPHAELKGYVLEHVLVATEALGRPLPDKACVHHINENRADNRSENLIICQDQAYHLLLHKRQRALQACGNSDWKRCKFCKRWDSPANLYVPPSGWSALHLRCQADYQSERSERNIQ